MISRVIFLTTLIGYSAFALLPPDAPLPLTPKQLQAKAKAKSRSDVCAKKKKQSKTVRELCKRWEGQQA